MRGGILDALALPVPEGGAGRQGDGSRLQPGDWGSCDSAHVDGPACDLALHTHRVVLAGSIPGRLEATDNGGA